MFSDFGRAIPNGKLTSLDIPAGATNRPQRGVGQAKLDRPATTEFVRLGAAATPVDLKQLGLLRVQRPPIIVR